jgi:hypothetical protein
VRGLRLVSQLGLTPDEATLQQMRDEAGNVRLVSASGSATSSRSCCSARSRRRRCGSRATPACSPSWCRSSTGDSTQHTFDVVQATADAGASLAVRLARLAARLGQANAARRRPRRARRQLARQALERLRYPVRLRA